jgi:hypothetical protein
VHREREQGEIEQGQLTHREKSSRETSDSCVCVAGRAQNRGRNRAERPQTRVCAWLGELKIEQVRPQVDGAMSKGGQRARFVATPPTMVQPVPDLWPGQRFCRRKGASLAVRLQQKWREQGGGAR